MTDQAWATAFGADLHGAFNLASVLAGNGIGNVIGGHVGAVANQSIEGGPDDHALFGHNEALALAGNGAGNAIFGGISAMRIELVRICTSGAAGVLMAGVERAIAGP